MLYRVEWPFLSTPADVVQLLANGHGGENEPSYLGMLPPELVERLCDFVDRSMGFDPFKDGPERERQLVAEAMQMRSSSATNWDRWKMLKMRSAPSYSYKRRSMTPISSPGSLAISRTGSSRAVTRGSFPRPQPPTLPLGPSFFLQPSLVSRQATAPYRFKTLTFWHPHELEDPVIVRGSRRRGYLASRV